MTEPTPARLDRHSHSNAPRALSRSVMAGVALVAALSATAPAEALGLSYLGQQIVPTGLQFGSTTVGGLSGIDRNPLTGAYVAISDDRSNIDPARMYGLTLDLSRFSRSATPGFAGVRFTSMTTLQTPAGLPFAADTVDPESIRFNPTNGNLLWSNEGQRGGAGQPLLQNPTVREITPGGVHLRDFTVPATFNPGSIDAGAPGIRNNLAFESLTVSTDGRTLYTATENALVQDGPAAAVGVSSPSRILAFDLASGAASAQFVYNVEPVALPPNPAGGFAINGLAELLAVGEGQFIAV
ncbi:MAG: esterase-like activity of phytase family protein, partial [Rubrivivax sp.]